MITQTITQRGNWGITHCSVFALGFNQTLSIIYDAVGIIVGISDQN